MDNSAKHFTRTQSSRCRVLDDVPAPRPQEQRLNYVYRPSFDDPSQEAAILAPMPGAEPRNPAPAKFEVPENVPPELTSLYTPLLSREQEWHLFRKMNFLKYRPPRLRNLFRFPVGPLMQSTARTQDPRNHRKPPAAGSGDQDLLVVCNMRLLVSIAKHYATHKGNSPSCCPTATCR